MKKRGVSPIIATVLLILIAIAIAIIIIWWIGQYIGESVSKSLSDDDSAEPIQNFCPMVEFEADVVTTISGVDITIQNNGNVPIYGIEVLRKGLASKKSLGIARVSSSSSSYESILPGETRELVTSNLDANEIGLNDDLILIPVLLGTAGEEKKAYPCDEDYGLEVEVGNT